MIVKKLFWFLNNSVMKTKRSPSYDFGSYSRNEQTPWSDVDILVQYDRNQRIGLLKIAGIQIELSELLGREVDLVEDGMLRPWAEESVNRDKKLIYKRAS